jgi:beta-galactosidase/beta-glucuronidase
MTCICPLFLMANEGRTVISLNGEWDFDQTQTAFPPAKFTREIPVPGLVHLAKPRIGQYEKFFKRPAETQLSEQFNFMDRDYTPMYNWYRKKIRIGKHLAGRQLFLHIKKSQYVTVVYVNGRLIGASKECYTPIEFNITDALRFEGENEILIQVGDRAWLPGEAAGSIDKEKTHYLPGIWDEVSIQVTGKIKVKDVLFLPSAAAKSVTVKSRLSSAYPPQMIFGAPMYDSCRVEFSIKEKASGKIVARRTIKGRAKRDNTSYFETKIPIASPVLWTPESPFLYEGEISVYDGNNLSDTYTVNFGMRDFSKKGKHFTLNNEKYYLRGSNITLHRFFEDPDCGNLAWDRKWVKKMLVDIPKSLHWNTMRICVGIVPDFWYDLCDEYGIVLQNEWLYWQSHGWDEQVRKEYTDWVWSDGNHPSIVIWDAINENWDNYIGNTLIPELKRLDPTRIWDAGYMTSDEMGNDEMDEPHPYRMLTLMPTDQAPDYIKKNPYDLGDLDNWSRFEHFRDAGVPQLVNEYGWIWLWRNGTPSKLTINNYNYYAGTNASPEARREMQAYWLQLETEWLRAERSLAGVLAFCYLTNNYGFTGDWFINDIKDLEPSPTLKWFEHCFAPQAVFINLTDQRYMKHVPPYRPGDELLFSLVGVNDDKHPAQGNVVLKLLNARGETVLQQDRTIEIPAYGKKTLSCNLRFPAEKGGYLLLAEYCPQGSAKLVVSRRYLKAGDAGDEYIFYDYSANEMNQ